MVRLLAGMSGTEGYAATLRCDACGELVAVPLSDEQAREYVGYIEQRDFDQAMGVLRRPGIYPRGWQQRPEVVARDTVYIDRHSGQTTASSNLVASYIDFCPTCVN